MNCLADLRPTTGFDGFLEKASSFFDGLICCRLSGSFLRFSVSSEQVSGINFVFDVFEDRVEPVGNDGVATFLELFNVIDDEALVNSLCQNRQL